MNPVVPLVVLLHSPPVVSIDVGKFPNLNVEVFESAGSRIRAAKYKFRLEDVDVAGLGLVAAPAVLRPSPT
jgi:hypothetical protein